LASAETRQLVMLSAISTGTVTLPLASVINAGFTYSVSGKLVRTRGCAASLLAAGAPVVAGTVGGCAPVPAAAAAIGARPGAAGNPALSFANPPCVGPPTKAFTPSAIKSIRIVASSGVDAASSAPRDSMRTCGG
jgi:hypothetical protein